MKRVFIITGELSGDKHAARIISELKQSGHDIEIEAVGGEYCKKAGAKLFLNHEKMSAMGIGLKILIDHIKLGGKISDYLINDFKPDLVLLVDYGGFNLGISSVLKKAGLKIFYYIPPQIWASRKYRINVVRKNIDKVLTIFPFETGMYRQNGTDAEFTGHPLIDEIPPAFDKKEVAKKLGLNPDKRLISIFPGSREFEIKNLLKMFVNAAEIIRDSVNDVEFALCVAPTVNKENIKKQIPEYIKIAEGMNYELLSTSDALMLASGTVALEAALYGTPMIISYKGPWILYFAYLMLRCIDKVCLPNIISGKDIVPELIQKQANSVSVAKSIIKILKEPEYRENMKFELNNVRKLLGGKNSAKTAAAIILKALDF